MSDYTLIILIAVVFFAASQQTLSGFGFSLIVMPLFSIAFGLRVAAPLVALISLTLYTINLVRYRAAVNFGEVKPLALAAILGVPFGIWILVTVNEAVVKTALGLILIAYALYALWNPVTLHLRSRRWAILAGFLAGALSGAYNTSGPPLIVYGSLRQWNKDEFRAILQLLFFISATITVGSHFLAQNITPNVLGLYALAAPALVLGIVVAARVDQFVNKQLFRKIVIALILVLGLSLVIR